MRWYERIVSPSVLLVVMFAALTLAAYVAPGR